MEADLYFAIESGISNQLGEWQVVSISIIENNFEISSVSTSAGFPIPERYINKILEKGVNSIMHEVFGNDINKNGIEFLTDGVFNRLNLIEETFIMGLIKIIHDNKWN